MPSKTDRTASIGRFLHYSLSAILAGGVLINAQADSRIRPVISQGDAVLHSDIVRAKYGLTGAEITVGVISDSYDCLGGAALGQQADELPADVVILKEGNCRSEDSTDEGRAMLEVIHDLAPKTKLLFHAMGNTTQDFVQALKQMSNAGAQIIVDDAVYFHEPMFQDGLAAQTIDQLVYDKGIAYFTSAGNSGRNTYQATFTDSHTYPMGRDKGVAHDFNPNPKRIDTCQSITVGADILTVFSLQWDQPSSSVDGGAGSSSDLDVTFYDDPECKKLSTGRVIGGFTANLGKDAAEVAGYSNIGNRKRKNIGIRILLTAGPAPSLIKYVLSGSSLPIEHPRINEYAKPDAIGSAFGHGNASGAFVVGALATPIAHARSASATSYSSLGGLPILFDGHGERLVQPIIRNHVDAVAPTNVNTSFFTASRPDPEHDGKPNFTGTSAAAPHVAGVAALLLQAAIQKSLKLKPSELYELLNQSSLDIGPPGFDVATGHGLIQADRAVQLLY